MCVAYTSCGTRTTTHKCYPAGISTLDATHSQTKHTRQTTANETKSRAKWMVQHEMKQMCTKKAYAKTNKYTHTHTLALTHTCMYNNTEKVKRIHFFALFLNCSHSESPSESHLAFNLPLRGERRHLWGCLQLKLLANANSISQLTSFSHSYE